MPREPFVWMLLVGACAEADRPGAGTQSGKKQPPEWTTGGGSGESSGGEGAAPLGDRCVDAPLLRVREYGGTLYKAQSDSGGVCGEGGPDVFVAVEVDRHADLVVQVTSAAFEPRLGLLGDDCSGRWDLLGLGCSENSTLQVLDVAAGSEVVVVVGIAPDDPKWLAATSSEDLAFSLAVDLRRVLARGELCGGVGAGRCASGTVCLGDPQGAPEVRRCAPLAGDSCATPTEVDLRGDASVEVVIDPGQPYSDAHAHSCTGAGTREQVLEVRLPANIDPAAGLRVATLAAEVGFAARLPGCLADHELACVAPAPNGAEIAIPIGDAHDSRVFVFVELPDEGKGELAPFSVGISLSSPDPGTSGG